MKQRLGETEKQLAEFARQEERKRQQEGAKKQLEKHTLELERLLPQLQEEKRKLEDCRKAAFLCETLGLQIEQAEQKRRVYEELRNLQALIAEKEQEKKEMQRSRKNNRRRKRRGGRELKEKAQELEAFGNLEEILAVLNAKYRGKGQGSRSSCNKGLRICKIIPGSFRRRSKESRWTRKIPDPGSEPGRKQAPDGRALRAGCAGRKNCRPACGAEKAAEPVQELYDALEQLADSVKQEEKKDAGFWRKKSA